jgi:pyruvate/2-oxoglutarate dehydrogenase complex dihydrolipoamide acyltransferase (E2) component
MPQLGEGVIEGTIAGWLKKEGDAVEQYEPILEIETDKVTTEATAEIAGTLLKILVPEGETVPVGTVLALVGDSGEEVGETAEIAPVKVAPNSKPAAAQQAADGPLRQAERAYTGRVSPVVGRIAEEHRVDLNLVVGTGRNGRITKKDILAYVEGQSLEKVEESTVAEATAPPLGPLPGATPLEVAPGELLPLSSIRRSIAEHMVGSKRTSPHVTTVFDVDFTAVAAHRATNKTGFAADGANLTFTAYIVQAIVQALKAQPMVNSTWTENGILLNKELNVGIATAISEGLIVPVIKNADGLSLLGLARSVNDLSERARNGRLKPEEVQGGTFTLTNHGVSGSLFATPIINQPQCGILGMGKIEKRVKVINDAIAIRPMAYASLTFDHRILDGATADAFMTVFKGVLEDWA